MTAALAVKPTHAYSAEEYRKIFATEGCVVIENVLSQDYIRRAKAELEAAIEAEAAYHGKENYQDYGMVLMCAQYGRAMVELFDHEALVAPFNAVLGEGSIVYAYTSSSMPPGKTNYSNRIHVDCPRVIPGYATNMGATIALDDFTEENGATWYLPRSHEREDTPSADEFYSKAKRFVAPAGSVFFFNARIWHAGGDNHTTKWRHGLTVNMCRGYMKQRLDIPRMMEGKDLSFASEKSLQKLGFHAQVPASYDEYYVPPSQRKFKQKTE